MDGFLYRGLIILEDTMFKNEGKKGWQTKEHFTKRINMFRAHL